MDEKLQINEFLQDIIEKAKSPDSKAIAEIFEYYYPKIYRYFYYRVEPKENAEDLTSEVFIKLVKSIKHQTGNFEAWLYMIAKNTLTDYYRRRAARKECVVDEEILEAIPQEKAVGNNSLTQEELKNALSKLSEEQQQVIILKFIEGYDNAKIAEIMKKSIGAVKALQFRALVVLRDVLREG